jgi:hypothetical protein
MVFYEGEEEILATTYRCLPAPPGKPNRFDVGFRRSTVYLHVVLISVGQRHSSAARGRYPEGIYVTWKSDVRE